jgi:hypothetical protein
VPGGGGKWENACLLHIVAGYFGVHGWSHGMSATWTLCFILFFVNRYFMAVDIFTKMPSRWHWAFVKCRLGIVPSKHTFRYVSGGLIAYECPPNYFWGALTILAFRAMMFPSGASKVICFVGNKCFMLHLIDHVMSVFGNRAWNVLRSWERINPPKMAIINIWLATLQALLFGTYLEIYRERVFALALDFLSAQVKTIGFTLRSLSVIMKMFDVFSCSKAPSHQTNETSKQSKSITLRQHYITHHND